MGKHQFYYDIQKAYDNYMNDNNETMFLVSIYESLIQYRIDNKLEQEYKDE